jgi:hypothetical protein
MSKTKFTPGPWILGGCSGRMITTPDGYVGDGFIADVDTTANAHLIASAPTLLAWLEWVRDNIVGDARYPDDITIDGYGLDGIISTARGEQP